MNLLELFNVCNNRRDYTTVTPENKKYEVDYKFVEDEDARTLYIFFEPSDGKVDWRVNFSYWRKPYSDMETNYKVHGGYLESWKLIDDAIGAKIAETCADGSLKWLKVVIVGYSHGGALAALCHEYVWYHREDLRAEGLVGISFDGPRIYGGLVVPKALKERWAHFYVFRNHSDIVTHLPPVLFFFRHVGTLVHIGAGKNPGWVGAHYPDKIRAGLEDFMKNGKMTVKEEILSALDGIATTAANVAESVRNLDPSDVRDKIESIVDTIKGE